jgi:phosphoglycolate phosphatase-like HAD superfamily hydrolase
MQMKLSNKKIIVLFDIDYTLFDTDAFKESNLTKFLLYREILPMLKSLADVAELGIFSKGEDTFQNTKLQQTEIGSFFKQENVHVFEDKDVNLKIIIEKYKDLKIYFVDDRLATLYNAKVISPSVFTIWIKRGPFARNQTISSNFSPDATLDNLNEVSAIVLGNS